MLRSAAATSEERTGMLGQLVETLTWPEAEAAIRRLPTAVLPIGARTKEHGLHLPIDNDFRLAEYLARRVAERCPVLLLPALPFGFYPAFVTYPGSVSLGFETFRDTVCDICRCFAAHGTERFYALNTGISTARPLDAACEVLAAEGISLRYTDFAAAMAKGRAEVETQECGTHADEIETSMMLYIAPETVRMELARADGTVDRGGGGLSRDPEGQGIFSPTGVYGDPTRATREKGERVVESVVAYLIDEVERYAAER
jgi:creatinine amidohydrolase